MVTLYQHNLQDSNLCAFTQRCSVPNPGYKPIAKFRIKFKNCVDKFIKDSTNRNQVIFQYFKH